MPLETIARNSTRLYHEAFDALERRRFSTATALAIFSVEEAAKYVIFKREAKRPDLPKKRVFKHEVKHEELGEFFWLWAIYSVLSDTFKDFKTFTESQPIKDQKTMSFIASLTGGDAVDFLRAHMFKSEEEMRVYVREHFPHPELLAVSDAARNGSVEDLRRKCLYVDLSEKRDSVSSTPEGITETVANEWFKMAWFGQEYIKLASQIWE